ncbi:MAG: hypothetical protein ACTSXA_06435 [Candidatus Heimdallarchaeota archaeon]
MISKPELEAQNKTADGKVLEMLLTSGILADVDVLTVKKMVDVAREQLINSVSWVVFCPTTDKVIFEDEGRTCRYPLRKIDETIKENIYAILDDYGSVEALQKSAGNPLITTQYVLTLLFAHEY